MRSASLCSAGLHYAGLQVFYPGVLPAATMFHFQRLLKKISRNHVVRENRAILIIFALFSLFFAAYMVLMEGIGLVDAYYFLVTTATTVGYGDFSPQTDFGKFLATAYMVVGIALLGLFLGKITDVMVNLSSRRKRGLLTMKGEVDLIIAGYPGGEKVENIVSELRNDPRYAHAKIVCVNNQLEIKPRWMTQMDVDFVQGVVSDSKVLEMAGVKSAHTALILANDPATIESDDHSSSICAVIERVNPAVRTIIEKVRQDEMIFEVVDADTIVEVAAPSILAQEVLDPGATELQKAIFSTRTRGTQFNLHYQGGERTWLDIAKTLLGKDTIPEGFRNPGDKHFNLLPAHDDLIKPGALIKYRGVELLTGLD
jgi:voltage-gated potassium channel